MEIVRRRARRLPSKSETKMRPKTVLKRLILIMCCETTKRMEGRLSRCSTYNIFTFEEYKLSRCVYGIMSSNMVTIEGGRRIPFFFLSLSVMAGKEEGEKMDLVRDRGGGEYESSR